MEKFLYYNINTHKIYKKRSTNIINFKALLFLFIFTISGLQGYTLPFYIQGTNNGILEMGSSTTNIFAAETFRVSNLYKYIPKFHII